MIRFRLPELSTLITLPRLGGFSEKRAGGLWLCLLGFIFRFLKSSGFRIMFWFTLILPASFGNWTGTLLWIRLKFCGELSSIEPRPAYCIAWVWEASWVSLELFIRTFCPRCAPLWGWLTNESYEETKNCGLGFLKFCLWMSGYCDDPPSLSLIFSCELECLSSLSSTSKWTWYSSLSCASFWTSSKSLYLSVLCELVQLFPRCRLLCLLEGSCST